MHHSRRLPPARSILALGLAASAAAPGSPASPGSGPAPDPRAIYDGHLLPDAEAAAFRHPERWFPSATVHRAERVRSLPAAAHGLPALHFSSNGRQVDLADYLAFNRVAALLVLKDGAVVAEDYELGQRPGDHWVSFSVAKSVSSTLVGIALAEGHIKSLDDPLSRYLPALAEGGYADVTVRNVLQMASGVAWSETYTDPGSDRRKVLDLQLKAQPGEILKYMAALRKAGPPGSRFNYSTGETFVIGALLEAATGRSLADYASATLWRYAGMEGDASWWVEAAGGTGAAGSGLGMSLRDFGRFGQYVLEDGRVGGRPTVPDGWFAAATQPQAVGGRPIDYGYLWWPVPAGDPMHRGAFEADGIFGQHVYINPAERLVIVVLSARPKPTGADVVDDHDFYAAVARALKAP